ncbi:MAG: nucleoside hydrolase, partial [Anaerolineaceae bacterium]
LDLLYANAQSGATVIGIGPLTNLAVLETLRPGAFENANVVIMGGHLGEPGETGLPQYGPEVDYNIQTDRRAAMIVFERVNPLIVPLAVTLKVCLRRSDLPALEAGGPLAKLLAIQAALHCADHQMDRLGAINAAVPSDILNFQYDSLACAAALGWDCLTVENIPLTAGMQDGCVVLNHDPIGHLRPVVTNVDAQQFAARWMEAVRPL